MLKKAMPLFLIAGIVLGGCTNNDAVPNNNETPMENVEDRAKDWTPKVRDDERGGTNLDGLDEGLDEGQDGTGTGVNEGVINEDNDMNGTDNAPHEGLTEEEIDRDINKKGNMNNH